MTTPASESTHSNATAPSAPRKRTAEQVLLSASDASWAKVAADDLDATLADHAHCEKKASASAIALINAYPGDEPLVRAMTALAIEEMEHFQEIYQLLQSRGVMLKRDQGDPYVKALLAGVRQPADQRKMDRLLISALIEARSCERFKLLKEELFARGDEENGARFRRLESSEAGHAVLFIKLARDEFGEAITNARLTELAQAEAEIVAKLPVEPRIH